MPGTVSDILTVEETADRMNMSVRYVRRLVADRQIPFHRIGRAIRITATDVDAFLASTRVEPITPSDVWRDLKGVA
jgi:excisionase family DNA binding protein